LRDLDPQAKVEYSVKADGTLAFSAVLSAAIEAPPTPTFLTKKTIGTTSIALGQATGTQIFKPYEIGLKVTDRAGNISTQTYKGMRLNLPELTEESMLLPDSLMPTLPDERNSVNPNDPNNANNPNDSSGGRLYIGAGGGWGYGTTSGTGAWNWNSSGNSPSTIPIHVLNPNEVIGYLPALRLALTTARDVLSNVPATAIKKDAVKRHLELLMETGKVVEINGFYEVMRPMLKGVFATAYAAGGITKRQAIVNGWELAKALALETKLTTLQIFETNLYATSLAALKQNNNTAPTIGLEAAVKSLAKTYARLNSVPDGQIDNRNYTRYDRSDFLGTLLHDGRASSGGDLWQVGEVVETSITKLSKHLLGQADVVKSLQFTDRMLQAASQVSQLYGDAFIQGVYGGYSYVTESFNMIGTSRVSNSIRDTNFLARLSDLAFEIARSNPTVTVGGNPTSEWIETLWEGGNLQSAAGGLSDWFSGFRVEKPVNPDLKGQLDYGSQVRSTRWRTFEALDYAGRLVQSVRSVNSSLAADVKRSDFLSHVINLGGAYAALNPTKYVGDPKSFLHTLWQTSTSEVYTRSNQELAQFLGGGNLTLQDKKQIFEYERNQLLTLTKLGSLKEQVRDPIFLAAVGVLSRYYQSDLKEAAISEPNNNFFTSAWNADSRSKLESIATDISTRSATAGTPSSASILELMLGSNRANAKPRRSRTSTPYTLPSNLAPWIAIDPSRPKVTSVGQPVGNKKALIIAPYAHQFAPYDESENLQKILKNSDFTVTMQRNGDPNINNIDIRRDLIEGVQGGYGVIAFVTHGNGFGPSNEEGLFTGQMLTSKAVLEYADMLWSKDLRFDQISATPTQIDLVIMPSFVKKYMKNIIGEHSIVYLGSCLSLSDNSLVDEFMAKGADTVAGYDRIVGSDFASAHGTAMFNVLATGRNTKELAGVGDIDFNSSYRATFVVKYKPESIPSFF
jgi:hypothetical protein